MFALVLAAALVVSLAAAAALSARPAAKRQATAADCRSFDKSQVKCHPGRGHHIPGGGSSTSHAGWPGFTGILWQVIANGNSGETRTGTQWNDELLGRNGSDHLSGGPGRDVIWGDSNATHNGPGQHDVLNGDGGADWIYASHGTNDINGGAGNDHITAAFGHGTIDCGPGIDHYLVRHGGFYKVRNCEKKGR